MQNAGNPALRALGRLLKGLRRRSTDRRGVGKRRAKRPCRARRRRPLARLGAGLRSAAPQAPGPSDPKRRSCRRSRGPRRGVGERRVGVRVGGGALPCPARTRPAPPRPGPGRSWAPSPRLEALQARKAPAGRAQAWGGANASLGRPRRGPSRRPKRRRPARAGRRRQRPRPGRRRRAIRPEARSSRRRPGRRGWPKAGRRGAGDPGSRREPPCPAPVRRAPQRPPGGAGGDRQGLRPRGASRQHPARLRRRLAAIRLVAAPPGPLGDAARSGSGRPLPRVASRARRRGAFGRDPRAAAVRNRLALPAARRAVGHP